VAQIAASISELGFDNPILVDTSAGIIASRGRLLAAQKLQLPEVPVIILDHLTDMQKQAYLPVLRGLIDEDSAFRASKPISRSGDLWLLGAHRLLVGDPAAPVDVERLVGGEAADLVFTDPWNEGYAEEKLKLKGDRMSSDQFQTFLAATFASYPSVLKPGTSLYVSQKTQAMAVVQGAELTEVIVDDGGESAKGLNRPCVSPWSSTGKSYAPSRQSLALEHIAGILKSSAPTMHDSNVTASRGRARLGTTHGR
jgi:hypothetical protein